MKEWCVIKLMKVEDEVREHHILLLASESTKGNKNQITVHSNPVKY